MIKCAKCGASPIVKPLTRVNPKGEDGEFWCWDCLKKHEPELFNNEKEDQSDLDKLLISELYGK